MLYGILLRGLKTWESMKGRNERGPVEGVDCGLDDGGWLFLNRARRCRLIYPQQQIHESSIHRL